jgi:hypothetical protein
VHVQQSATCKTYSCATSRLLLDVQHFYLLGWGLEMQLAEHDAAYAHRRNAGSVNAD